MASESDPVRVCIGGGRGGLPASVIDSLRQRILAWGKAVGMIGRVEVDILSYHDILPSVSPILNVLSNTVERGGVIRIEVLGNGVVIECALKLPGGSHERRLALFNRIWVSARQYR